MRTTEEGGCITMTQTLITSTREMPDSTRSWRDFTESTREKQSSIWKEELPFKFRCSIEVSDDFLPLVSDVFCDLIIPVNWSLNSQNFLF